MIPTIETERLILRPLAVDDAEAVFAWTGYGSYERFDGSRRFESKIYRLKGRKWI